MSFYAGSWLSVVVSHSIFLSITKGVVLVVVASAEKPQAKFSSLEEVLFTFRFGPRQVLTVVGETTRCNFSRSLGLCWQSNCDSESVR